LWLIAGAGFTGKRLALRLGAAGDDVIALGRTAPDIDHPNVECRAVDAADPEALAGLVPRACVVVNSVPPTPGNTAPERNLAAAAAGARRAVYLSSTGVYPPGDGGWVDEESPVGPAAGGRGEARLAAETAFMNAAAEAGVEAVALRIGGIYGPGRGVHARLARGNFRVLGAGDTPVNRIHVDDLCAIIEAAGRVEPLVRPVYTVADDAPTPSREVGDGVAAMMSLPPPPSVPLDQVPPHVAAMLGANRRVSNRRAKDELGVTLRYPSWREGVAACLAEERLSGA